MGILGDLFTLATAPAGSSAYVIIKKGGGTLKRVEALENGKYSYSWNIGSMTTLRGSCLYWDSESDAKYFASARGLNLNEIEISWRQVV